jgi:hypothetical protein
MANAGIVRLDIVPSRDAVAFLKGEMILQPGFIMLVDQDDEDTGLLYFGVGKAITETPSIQVGMLSRLIALENGAVTPPPWPISNITNLLTALDSKAALIHAHAISDVTGLQGELNAINGVLDDMYVPGVGTADEGTF